MEFPIYFLPFDCPFCYKSSTKCFTNATTTRHTIWLDFGLSHSTSTATGIPHSNLMVKATDLTWLFVCKLKGSRVNLMHSPCLSISLVDFMCYSHFSNSACLTWCDDGIGGSNQLNREKQVAHSHTHTAHATHIPIEKIYMTVHESWKREEKSSHTYKVTNKPE